MDVYTPIALKIHAFGLQRLQDPNWTGTILYDVIKRPFRQGNLLQEFCKHGFLIWLGNLLFDEYLAKTECTDELQGEYLVWYLEDFCEFLRHHQANKGLKSLTKLEDLISKIGVLNEKDEEKYWRCVSSRQQRERMHRLFYKLIMKKK